MTMIDFTLQLLGIHVGKGTTVHLYDLDGERRFTVCGRRIGVNPRFLGPGNSTGVSADLADCPKCRREGL
jgi:hypothetical protein